MATLAQKWTGTLTDFTREVEQYTSDRCTEMVSRCRDGRLSAPPSLFRHQTKTTIDELILLEEQLMV